MRGPNVCADLATTHPTFPDPWEKSRCGTDLGFGRSFRSFDEQRVGVLVPGTSNEIIYLSVLFSS